MTKHRELLQDGTGLIALDPWLEPYGDALRHRYRRYKETRERIELAVGTLDAMSKGYTYFGFNRGMRDGQPGVWYREWAPGATQLYLIGDFNHWHRSSEPLVRDEYGIWSIFLPDSVYGDRLVHGSYVKVHVVSPRHAMDRIPAYIRRLVQETGTAHFNGQYWQPPQPYRWRHRAPVITSGLRIYEAHVGMATEDERIGTYAEFTANILPRIADLGYNAVQLMAIMEHPYYGSFGYHVSSLFAASSRFGTPEDLKALIDTAHRLGLVVFLDIVHSHAVKNLYEGLNEFDGTEYQYFHAGGRGQHAAWDSLLYDYHKFEVLRFLLSNVRFWLEEFRFDGLRFDGVTSMMYLDHGLGKQFSSYDAYFHRDNLDEDAISYLQLANVLAHQVNPHAITIAEEVSGMVGLARPVTEGGLGFDYRLSMGVPDYWIKVLKEKRDEQWQLGELYSMLLNRRQHEKHIGYCESHDQALVGDKTIAFWLMDADMYWNMNNESRSLVVERGMALHKMIRLVTFSLGGEGYLTFMGNEFGHPEWIDFPRPGNHFSYRHARRQWSLVDNGLLRYHKLRDFDQAMLTLDRRFNLLVDIFIEQLLVDEERKLLIYRRGPLVFAVNFHASTSYHDHRIPVPDRDDYVPVLTTDAAEFGGFGNVKLDQRFVWQQEASYGREQSIQVYLPSRTALVLAPATWLAAQQTADAKKADGDAI